MTDISDRVSLATAIASLRQQLAKAAEQAKELDADEVRLNVTGIELELSVVAEDATSTEGEVGWWILKAKAGVNAKDVISHRIKISLSAGDLDVNSGKSTG